MSEIGKSDVRCPTCGWRGQPDDRTPRRNPLNEETLWFCPKCETVDGEHFVSICDEPGCESEATCGFPDQKHNGIYRWTCGKHSEWQRDKDAQRAEGTTGC